MELETIAAVENVTDFVSNHVLDCLASRFQILTGVKVCRMFHQVFTNGSGHCQTQVSIDVDFANAKGTSFQKHVFGNALCTVKFAAVFITFFYESGDNGGSTMENQGEARKQVGNFFQTSEVQFRFAFEGEGPFVTELFDADGNHLRDMRQEYGTVTVRPRRCGWLDAFMLRYSARVNGLDYLAITRLDILDALPNREQTIVLKELL